MPQPRPTDEYQEPPDDAFPPEQPPMLMPADVVTSTLETLNLLDEYFRRHASPTARADLRAFAARQGCGDPDQGAQIIIEGIGINALALTRARDTAAPG
jgi:hypothetical protein